MMNLIKRFITDEFASTATEYALIAAGIVLAAYTSMQELALSPLAFLAQPLSTSPQPSIRQTPRQPE